MNLISTLSNCIEEQEIKTKTPKPNKSFLYHGTNIKNLNNIKKYGLIPDFGDTVKGTEAYGNYMDYEYMNPDDRVDGILFFSDKPDVWSYSNFGKTANVNDAVIVIIKKNKTIYKKIAFDYYDMKNNKVNWIKYNNHDYIDVDKLPFFIEDGDYFSLDEQDPFDILYGERLVNYLKQFS